MAVCRTLIQDGRPSPTSISTGAGTFSGAIAANGDSITSDGVLVINATSATSFNDEAITNVSDIALDTISADGTNIDITATAVSIGNGATAAGILAINEDADAGSNNATFTVPALTADTDYTLPPDDGDAGEQLQTNGSGTLTWETAGTASGQVVHIAGATWDGGGSAISSPGIIYRQIPMGCTITGVTILAITSGSATIDIWVDTYANYPPTDADTITAAAVPATSAAVKYNDETLTGWTTGITAEDTIAFNVDSISGHTWLEIQLYGTRT